MESASYVIINVSYRWRFLQAISYEGMILNAGCHKVWVNFSLDQNWANFYGYSTNSQA
jgi:hypothetical protein